MMTMTMMMMMMMMRMRMRIAKQQSFRSLVPTCNCYTFLTYQEDSCTLKTRKMLIFVPFH